MIQSLSDAISTHWKLFLIQGVVLLVLGVFAVCSPAVATTAVDYYIGALFIVSGVTGLVAMFSAHDVPAFFWALVTAALAWTIGILLIWKPNVGAQSLTILLCVFFIAEGLFQVAGSFAYKNVVPNSWGWMLLSGISDFVLAGIIIFSWPVSATWTLGLLVGINLIMSGAAIVFTALEGKSMVNSLKDAVTA
jgi:uncharacterized membrane protein HdeD (DUF308 family)